MTFGHGIWWPDGSEPAWAHALDHVRSVEWALAHCAKRRVAIQAGGNIGLWPKRIAEVFERVYSFEPEPVSLECLQRNAPANVVVTPYALGDETGWCDIKRKGLGSNKVKPGGTIPIHTIDSGFVDLDVDFIQLDVEGYEWHVLNGARQTLASQHPLVQVELRESMLNQFGKTAHEVRSLLAEFGYREVSRQQGSDVVFQ